MAADVIEHRLTVEFRHRVCFTRDAFGPSNPILRELFAAAPSAVHRRTLVVAEQAVITNHPGLAERIQACLGAMAPHVQLVAPPLQWPGGESLKNSPDAVARIHAAIHAHHIDRQSFVVGLGGGALLDVVGYATATAHRGCRHVRFPTTTLAQADSGVGVKNGINAFGQKNFLGTFAPPFAVINDFNFLASLSPRDRRAGCAEAVKVALIRDAAFFEWLEAHADALARGDTAVLETMIRRCAELHLRHIATAGDPFEFGSARPLDFGHWSAHKLEHLSHFRLRHGEAVALGIAIDTLCSRHEGWLPAPQADRVLRLLDRLGFDRSVPEFECRDDRGRRRLLEGLDDFREHLGGELTLTMLRDIGRGFEVHHLQPATLEAALATLAA